jgi:hypothetical protein
MDETDYLPMSPGVRAAILRDSEPEAVNKQRRGFKQSTDTRSENRRSYRIPACRRQAACSPA